MILKKPANRRAFFVHYLSAVSMIDENDLYLFHNPFPYYLRQTKLSMKLFYSFIVSFASILPIISAEEADNASMLASESLGRTMLGVNETLAYKGIAIDNRLKMRGFIDFRLDYTNFDSLISDDDTRFRTFADIDFLMDFSPVSGEIHFGFSNEGVDLEQAFLRYSFNKNFNLTAGRQLAALSYEKDESPSMYQTSYAYITDVMADVREGGKALEDFVGITTIKNTGSRVSKDLVAERKKITDMASTLFDEKFEITSDYLDNYPIVGIDEEREFELPGFRRNYVDGVRFNYNNGRIGYVAGLHNGYFTDSNHQNNGNIGLDLAASFMLIPGLELRLGYGYEKNDAYNQSISGYNSWASNFTSAVNADRANRPSLTGHDFYAKFAKGVFLFPESDDISQVNLQVSYQTGGLTLAFEWDMWDVYVIDMWNIMMLANYQFNDVFGLTFRYSHENFEMEDDVPGGGEGSSNRFTIGPIFSVTDNLTVGIEYSHAELDSTNTGDTSVDELYAETIFSF